MGLLFNTNMPALLWVGDCVIVSEITINYVLIILITSVLYYTLEEGDMEPNGKLFLRESRSPRGLKGRSDLSNLRQFD